MPVVDRNLARIAVYEMLHRDDIDDVVAISEAGQKRDLNNDFDQVDSILAWINTSAPAVLNVLPTVALNGTPVAVVNVMGQLFLDVPRGPFELIDGLVEEARKQADVVVVDFHAEATSEKVAAARWLDGKVTAVIGTHTHVQTSDARIQPGGTAAITDAGMTGPHDSVIGVEAELAIRRMRTGMPVRFRPAEGGVRLEGVVVDCDAAGKATAIEALRIDVR